MTPTINTNHQLPAGQYFVTKHKKSQIFIHFTAGGPSAENTMAGWAANDERIGTAYIIDRDGEILQAFPDDCWAFHLGIKGSNGKLDKTSIGIEICAWGPLTFKDGKYYNYLNREVAADQVTTLDKPHRGFTYYQSYSQEQMDSLQQLLIHLVAKYDIQVQADFPPAWYDFNANVLKNSLPGIWTHTSVRKDKYDSHPDERLTNILKNLS